MNGINLIPASRLAARRRSARLRVWLSIAPVCITALAGSYGYLFATWDTGTGKASQTLAETSATIESIHHKLAATKAAISDAEGRLRAARAVAEQPDWGMLLWLLARSLNDQTVLSSCTLDPVASAAPEPAKPVQPPKPGARAPATTTAAAAGSIPTRSGRYRLQLSGFARSQDAVPEFVRRLERAGVFEQTTLIQSVRTPFAGADAFQFKIECSIADSAGEGR